MHGLGVHYMCDLVLMPLELILEIYYGCLFIGGKIRNSDQIIQCQTQVAASGVEVG